MKEFVEKTKKWIAGIFNDERGNPSSKRFVGVLCSVCLCVVLFVDKHPNNAVVDAVALLAFGCLGLSSIDKFTARKKEINEAISNTPEPAKTPCPNCGQEDCQC